MGLRLLPRVVQTRISPNKEARASGVPLSLIILHDTESPRGPHDAQNIGAYFADASAQVSSHVVVGEGGKSVRCVPDHLKAWHVVRYNSATLGIEQTGYSTDGFRTWWRNRAQLDETARWIAHWSLTHGIPIQVGKVSNGWVTRRGVLRHRDLGADGGNHNDPGPGYPMAWVLVRARYIRRLLLKKPPPKPSGPPKYPGQSVHEGQSGATVKLIQQALNRAGAKIAVDSRYGPATTSAVRAYQRKHKLDVTGRVNHQTWRHLFPGSA